MRDPLEAVHLEWYVNVDDLVGGYIVTTIDAPTSQLDRRRETLDAEDQAYPIVAECFSLEMAQYIAEYHNKLLHLRKEVKRATNEHTRSNPTAIPRPIHDSRGSTTDRPKPGVFDQMAEDRDAGPEAS